MSCPRDSYRFLLTSDRDFVGLPEPEIELSKSRDTQVRVVFDSHGLDPGTHSANVTLTCRNCGDCRSSNKVIRLALTVAATAPPPEGESIDLTADPPGEAVGQPQLLAPNVTDSTLQEAEEQLDLLGLEPFLEDAAIARTDLITVIGQQPAAGAPVDSGARVILTPGVPVPDLVGLTAEEAQARVDEVGLRLVSTTSDVAYTASQLPVAGALVRIGTTVNLILPVFENPTSDSTWIIVLTVLLLPVVAIFFWRASARKPTVPAASFSVRSTLDAGSQEIIRQKSDPQRPVIRVRLITDAGEQSLQGEPASTTEKE